MNKKIIGFDLDGVIVSDLNWFDCYGKKEYEKRMNTVYYLLPLFQPSSICDNYVILTSRPVDYKERTMNWLKTYMVKMPMAVYHENKIGAYGTINWTSSYEYKLSVLMKTNIDLYFESDKECVDYLKERLTNKSRVIHFDMGIPLNYHIMNYI